MAAKRPLGAVAAAAGDEKRMRMGMGIMGGVDCGNPFDALDDNLVLVVLEKVSASAGSPADLVNVYLSCKRMKQLIMEPIVLRNASVHAISVCASSWCDQAHRFLSHCVGAGNMDACYMLGMIEFYCLGNYGRGADLLARAAQASHVEALYSLAIIQSRGVENSREPNCRHDLGNSAELCAKSAKLGHSDAIIEIGYFWSGSHSPGLPFWFKSLIIDEDEIEKDDMELDGDLDNSRIAMQYGTQAQPANLFLVEWWQLAEMKSKSQPDGLHICSRLCGRREIRRNMFYRCSCNKKFYCSHACKETHWKTEHHANCNDRKYIM